MVYKCIKCKKKFCFTDPIESEKILQRSAQICIPCRGKKYKDTNAKWLRITKLRRKRMEIM